MEETQIWRDVCGYKNTYMVSDCGRVISLDRIITHSNGKRCFVKGIILSQFTMNTGYKDIHLNKNGFRKRMLVHRLVAIAFIPNPDNKPCIDHIDGNRSNNHVSNLRWCTQKENNNFPLALKRKSECKIGRFTGSENPNYGNKYEKNPISKPVLQFTKKGKFLKRYASAVEAGDSLGKKSYNICRCCNKIPKYKTAYGFKWAFEN